MQSYVIHNLYLVQINYEWESAHVELPEGMIEEGKGDSWHISLQIINIPMHLYVSPQDQAQEKNTRRLKETAHSHTIAKD